MRWMTYLLLGYLALGVQVGFAGFVGVRGAAPNVVLAVALFIAFNAPREPALLGCLLLGIMQDLLTEQTLGIHALGYGLIGLFVTSTQAIIYRDHPLTQFSMALAGMLLVSIITLIQGWIWFDPSQRVSVGALFYSTLLTAIVSPVVIGLLGKVRFVFGFQPLRRMRV